MSVKADLITLLETFKFPVFLQGSVNANAAYPDSFFTFWNFETPEAGFYDNDANRAVWGFWVYFYSVDPVLIETTTEAARKLLKQNDWILQGKPYDISVDRPTHTGVIFTALKFENYVEEQPEPEPEPEPETPQQQEPGTDPETEGEGETNNNTESEE